MTRTVRKPRAAVPGRRAILPAIAVLLAAGFAAHQYFATSAAPPDAGSSMAPVPVLAGLVTRRDLPVWLSGIGTVVPLSTVDVKVRVDGQLQSVAFAEGQEVVAGQLLAQIDPRPYQAVLAGAVATRQRDLAQFANAQQEVARASKLARAGAGTSQNFDTAKAQQAALAASLDADQARIDAARLNLEFTRIVAPQAGRLGLQQIDPGSLVHANDPTGLVTVTRMAPISVLFSLPQDELDAVVAGQSRGRLPVAADSRDGATHIADGTLVFINSTIDQGTGEIELRADFANAGRRLWPGEFVSARVLVRTDRGATVVPSQAVLSGQDGLYVYAVQADGRVQPRLVGIGPAVLGFTEIRAGLHPGERVVLDGQSRLRPGSRVTIAPELAQTAAP